MTNDSDLICRIDNKAGRITLNRPQNLNALSHKMVLAMEKQLLTWLDDDTVECIIIDATGDKAFCAGGDLISFYEQKQISDYQSGRQFWRDEYRLNHLIANYPKPYIPIMSGFVMGGGVGISIHGSNRVVTETTKFALPECSIGLIPDVGSTFYLAQAPGSLGEYVGLTGTRLIATDALYCNFADHFVLEQDIESLIDKIRKTGDPSVIKDYVSDHDQSILQENEQAISAVFGQENLSDIQKNAHAADNTIINKAANLLSKNSPLAVQVAHRVLQNIRQNPSVDNALQSEYRFVSRVVEHGDFVEGIRAVIIDKDKTPVWQYQSIDDVPEVAITPFLKPAEDGALDFITSR